MDPLDLRDDIIDYLAPLDVDITDGEPETGSDGRVRRTVILDVTSGTGEGYRMAGRGTRARRSVNVLVVASSRDSCVWLTERVLELLDGARLTGGGTLTDASYDGPPTPEPGTTSGLWSKALTLTAITRRSPHGTHVR